MSSQCTLTRTAAAVASSLSIMLVAGPAFGAGFALQENSGSGLGNAYAGGAAAAETRRPCGRTQPGWRGWAAPRLSVP